MNRAERRAAARQKHKTPGPTSIGNPKRRNGGRPVIGTNPEFQRDEWDTKRGAYYRVTPPLDNPCARCPFLVENFDRVGEPPLENPGTYLPSTRRDLWERGARTDGEALGDASCHAGPPGEGLAGGGEMFCHIRREDYSGGATEGIVVKRCTSAAVLQERELLRYIDDPEASALTWTGAAIVASRTLGRTVHMLEVTVLDVGELLEHMHPALLDPRVGFEGTAPLTDAELMQWRTSAQQRAAYLT